MYEIERKFLLSTLPSAVDAVEPTEIRQGYLAVTDDVEVRVRSRAGVHLLTVKGGRGIVRREVTLEIDADRFEALWDLTDGRQVRKRRWVLPHDDGVEIEVDAFEGALKGLLIAEVEFDSEQASQAFAPPDWFGREVTDDDAYRNAALAVEPPPEATAPHP